MKKLLTLLLLFPFFASASTFSVPWTATSTTNGLIFPFWNAAYQSPIVPFIVATSTTASSSFAGGALLAVSSGSVGIGSSTPFAKLGVSGNILSNNGGNAAENVLIGDQAVNGGFPGIWFGTNANAPSYSNYSFLYDSSLGTIFNAPTGGVNFRVANTTYGVLNANGLAINNGPNGPGVGYGLIVATGNVGIGTLTPTAPLNIVANGTLAQLTTTGAFGEFKLSGGALDFRFGLDTSSGFAYEGTFSNHPLNFYTNSAVAETILANGNVGIGNSSPNVALDVQNEGRILGGAASSGFGTVATAGKGLELAFNSSSNFSEILTFNRDTSAYLGTQIEGNPLLLNFNSGFNVGVGATTTPYAALSVHAASNGGDMFAVANSSNQIIAKAGQVLGFDSHYFVVGNQLSRVMALEAGSLGSGFEFDAAGGFVVLSAVNNRVGIGQGNVGLTVWGTNLNMNIGPTFADPGVRFRVEGASATSVFQGIVGIGTSTPTATFQVATSTANATTSVQFGKANQTKGTCLTIAYDTAGSPVYEYFAAGAITPTYQNGGTPPSGCQN